MRWPDQKTKSCEICGGPIREDNLSGYCRNTTQCRTARRKLQRQKNPEGYKNYRLKYEEVHRIENVLRSIYHRARKQGIPCTLKLRDIPPESENCPCCGIAMSRGGSRNVTPNLDKIIPAIGYVPGNVQWLCGRCNRIKQDASPAELQRIADFITQLTEEAERLAG